MQAWRTKRTTEYSVHMTSDEVVDLINETAEALDTAYALTEIPLPQLDRLHTKLSAILGKPKGTRA